MLLSLAKESLVILAWSKYKRHYKWIENNNLNYKLSTFNITFIKSTIVGITLYGHECASERYSDIFTRGTYCLDWIRLMNVIDAATIGATRYDYYYSDNKFVDNTKQYIKFDK